MKTQELLHPLRRQYWRIHGRKKRGCWLYVALVLGASYSTVCQWACGSENANSKSSEKIKRMLMKMTSIPSGAGLVAGLLLSLNALAGTVELAWTASPTAGIASYRIYSGPISRGYTTNITVSPTNSSAWVSNVTVGITYWGATAVLSNGVESLFSNEATSTNLNFGPTQLIIRTTLQSSVAPSGPWSNMASMEFPLPPIQDTNHFVRSRVDLLFP